MANDWVTLRQAIHEGAVQRVRPKLMTVAAALIGLLPVMWSTGAGSEVMKRIAAPMVGGKMVRWTEADSAINAVADLCLAPLLGVVFSSIF
jgi:Cu/Ag efflux pump CusA